MKSSLALKLITVDLPDIISHSYSRVVLSVHIISTVYSQTQRNPRTLVTPPEMYKDTSDRIMKCFDF